MKNRRQESEDITPQRRREQEKMNDEKKKKISPRPTGDRVRGRMLTSDFFVFFCFCAHKGAEPDKRTGNPDAFNSRGTVYRTEGLSGEDEKQR